MAKDIPFVASATLVDSWGIEASAPAYGLADGAQTLASVVAAANEYFAALDGASDAMIRRTRIEIVPALPTGVKTAAAAGAKVEQTGLFNFDAAGTSKRYALAVPAISDGEMVGDRLTLGAGGIAVLIAVLTTVYTALVWCNDHSQEITKFVDALVSFRKKRKQLQRSSFEAAP